MQNVNNTPAGYLKNAKGHLVPQELVKPIDALRDELVRDLCAEANNISEQLASFKRRALARIDEFVEFSAAEYDVKMGGKKGNIDLVSYDGELKIVVQVRDLLQLDERMLAARALIDEYLAEMLDGAKSDIVKLINGAFSTDPAGQVSVSKVMGLRRIDIDHPTWRRAMQALVDAMSINGSCRYIRLYRRAGSSSAYTSICLDIAQADAGA